MNRQALRSLVLGGLLPVVAFTVIEELWGIAWGVVAGMVFGLGEVLYEWLRFRKVSPLTWGGNGMIVTLGLVSLFTQDGIWFKLQPAILEGVMALALWGSCLAGAPLLAVLGRRQLPAGLPEAALARIGVALNGLTWRLGLFFALHAGLAVWAALAWSTAAWGLLKGAGFTLSLVIYMAAEAVVLRRDARRGLQGSSPLP
ncbi:MAG: septation protein IspZ [Oligoflexia bacterium]|nr:septation protein IspZ [Oligoflexia bacterium]